MAEADSVSRVHVSGTIDDVERLITSYQSGSLSGVQTTTGKLGARIHALATRRVELRDVSFDAGILLTIHNPVSRFGMTVGVAGETRVFGRALTSSSIGFLNGRNGMIARLQPGSRWCNLALDRNLVNQVAETHGYAAPNGDCSRSLPLQRRRMLAATLSAIAQNRLMCEISDAELEDELARCLLREMNAGRRCSREWRVGRLQAVHRIIDFIQAEYAGPVTVTELCGLVGLSERTVQYRFREITGFSVQQYLMNYRLHRAHELLCHGDCAQVGEAARGVGIHHAGRFSQYYKQLFGRSPRETLAGR